MSAGEQVAHGPTSKNQFQTRVEKRLVELNGHGRQARDTETREEPWKTRASLKLKRDICDFRVTLTNHYVILYLTSSTNSKGRR
jgi:hypothetical protein